MADIIRTHGGYAHNFDPHRSPPPLLSPNSVAGTDLHNDSETDSSAGSFVDIQPATTRVSPSIAKLAEMYNFPPFPPPAPTLDKSSSSWDNPNDYQSGIMMAGQRLKEALCSPPPKRSAYAPNHVVSEPRKPIPGWTDGSHAWRSAVYSFSAPRDLSNPDPVAREHANRAYKSFVASPHRSKGVCSTLSDAGRTNALCCTASLPSKHGSETEALYSKYAECLSRRSESRASMFPASTSPTSPHALPRRERPILKPGAEGKLLVPDVKLRVHAGSSASLSSTWCGSSYTGDGRAGSKSPPGSEGELRAGGVPATFPGPTRPVVESQLSRSIPRISVVDGRGDAARSWSYDNVKTYPIMPIPPKKEKRIEKRIVDGEEVDIEVEVEVFAPLKRLFLFAGKETRVESY
jgi:hypothetical protein